MCELTKAVKKGQIDFDILCQHDLPASAKDLLVDLLQPETIHRFEVTEALNHPFFCEINDVNQGLAFSEWGLMDQAT
jgi:hypothetical protein